MVYPFDYVERAAGFSVWLLVRRSVTPSFIQKNATHTLISQYTKNKVLVTVYTKR